MISVNTRTTEQCSSGVECDDLPIGGNLRRSTNGERKGADEGERLHVESLMELSRERP